MARAISLAIVMCATSLSACAVGSGPGEMSTGSIFPALPSLPSASSLMPNFGGSSGSQRPERISGNLYRVYTNDRRLDDSVQRENYALLRAAEGAKEVGGTHFIVVNANQAGVDVGSSTAGSSTSGTFIRVLSLEAGSQPPAGAIAANEIIHFFGPTFGRGQQAQPATTAAPAAPATPG